jgi:hypothetical protein
LEIDAAVAALQTKGRARVALRGRILELARHRKTLAATPAPPPPATFGTVLATARTAIDKLAFAEAAGALKALQTNDAAERSKRDAWLYLTEAAAACLGELEKDTAGGTLQGVTLGNRQGDQQYDKITGSKAGGLLLAQGAKPPVFVPWAELAADGVIELHKRATSGEMKQLEKLRRHEQAIAYDFLVGDRQRAETAAARLAESSPAFGARWNTAVQQAGL